MRYDTIHPLYTFFLGNYRVADDCRNLLQPKVSDFINETEPRLREFLDDNDALPCKYCFSFAPRAYFHNNSTLYAVYLHFSDQALATAFRLMWDGEVAFRNY